MRVAFAVSVALLSACVVGDGSPSTAPGADAPSGSHDAGGGGGTDAASGGIDAGPGSGSGSGSAFTCRNVVTAGLGNGHHNAGTNCMDGCHNHGFTLAGTLYTSAAGTTVVAGGTITVVGANGVSVDVVSQTNGNFYTSSALTFPVTITASECPNIQPMTAKVTAGQKGCNETGCHASAAGQGRIHLP